MCLLVENRLATVLRASNVCFTTPPTELWLCSLRSRRTKTSGPIVRCGVTSYFFRTLLGHPQPFETIGIKTKTLGFNITPGATASNCAITLEGVAEIVELPL